MSIGHVRLKSKSLLTEFGLLP